MGCDNERTIVVDPNVLSENHSPEDIHARGPQMEEIVVSLRPISDGTKPMNCWLHGEPGAGKTATARAVLRRFQDEAGIHGIYINCWENPTFFAVLECIAREMRVLGAEKLSTSFKLERLKRHLHDQRIILVLDEIDQPPPKERNAILYNLAALPTGGLICACNSQDTYFSLEDRVKSRLNPARVHFEEYSRDELFRILEQRALHALAPSAYTPDLLRRIAQLADGDARIAIQTLRNAAQMTDAEGKERITAGHVKRAWNSAKDLKKTYQLRKLTDHHRLLHELILKNPGILSGDLWRLYLRACRWRRLRPIAVRTYSDYCNKLVELGLVQSKRAAIQGKVREFSVLR